MNTTTLSAFFLELEKIAVHIRSPEHGKRLRVLFRELRGIGKIAPGDSSGRMSALSTRANSEVARLVHDPRAPAVREILYGDAARKIMYGTAGKNPASRLADAKKVEPMLNKKHVRTSLAQRSLNLPVNKRLFTGANGDLTENSAKTLNSIKNSRIAKAFEKGDKGKLRFKKGKHSGSYTPRYDVEHSQSGKRPGITSMLIKSEPGSTKRDIGMARSRLADLEKSHNPPSPSRAAPPHTPPPPPPPTPGTPKNNHLPAKLVAGAGGVGLAGYAAHRFLKKKKEE